MKKNLFFTWLLFTAMLLSVNLHAQMTIGGKKAPEPFSALEVLNIGGVRLPQMTTADRNDFAVKGNVKGEGLTIYNIDTKCVEYWNKTRWVSLCEGTSQASISPQPCTNVPADATGCDQTFSITDPDCPNGPFTISIVAGGEYAALNEVDNANGSFKVAFSINETVNTHTVLVRVTSTCTSLYKEFLFSQNGVDCTSMSYSVPTVSPAGSNLALCAGGAVYLSVPAATANLDKLIWTRNDIEVARGVNYYVATLKGKYNVSMGAVGCNTNAANERNVTESGTTAPAEITALASNNGVICGTGKVTLSATGVPVGKTAVWFHNGVQDGAATNSKIISGDSSVGEWFAAVKDGECYSKVSNRLNITKDNTASGQVNVPAADVLVNGKALNTFTAFCAGGSLDLSIANKNSAITYTWYNGNDVITVNPFIVPSNQAKISLRMVATDNSGAKCAAEASVVEKDVVTGSTPAQPNITGNATLCDGTTDLTLVPAVPGTYTYTWYKDGEKMTENTATITVTTPGVTYSGSVTNATGCASTLAIRKIADNVSSLPVLTFVTKPASATYGAKVTMQTAIEFGPASSYTWTADNGATVTGSGASVTIQLPASGTEGTPLKITAQAVNTCGKSVTIDHTITMNSECPTPVLTAQAALSQSVTQGSGVTVSVSVSGGVTPTYQWYSSPTASTASGTAISGATTASYLYTPGAVGTFYLYCIVTNGCTGRLTATSAIFTVSAEVNPSTLAIGAGTLRGKTCFDIAESNDNADCGRIASRVAMKSDFNLAAANTQTYTFTPSGTVSKVRFAYVESVSGVIVKSISNNGIATALNIGSSIIATVVYKNTLSTSGGVQGAAYGKDKSSPLTVTIYAIYNDKADGTGVDKAVKLTANIKDCMCCGALLSATVWREFLCHNLGANQSLDPFTPSRGLLGDLYNWGTKKPTDPLVPNFGTANQWDNSLGIKTALDPCPDGYRVPTKEEFMQLVTGGGGSSLLTTINNGYGSDVLWKTGSSLALPTYMSETIKYLTSTAMQSIYSPYMQPFYTYTYTSNPSQLGTNWSSYTANAQTLNGYVRCISEN